MTDRNDPVFKSPLAQRAGDVLLGVVLAPIMVGSVAFLCAIVGLLAAGLIGVQAEPRQAALAGAVVGVPLALVSLRPRAWWRIRLGERALQLGGHFFGRRVPYEMVRFIRAGRPHHWRAGYPAVRASIPLLIDTGWPSRYRIHLRPSDAQACLEQLHEQCRFAVAVDESGREYLPRDPGYVGAGRKLLARFWIGSGMFALGAGALTLFACAWIAWLMATGRVLTTTDPRALPKLMAGLVIGPGLMAFGWGSVRRGRRHALPTATVEQMAASQALTE